MAKGLSKRKQKRNRSVVIEDLRKLTTAKSVKKAKNKKKNIEINKVLKEFKFSQITAEIKKLNKNEIKQSQIDKTPDTSLDNEQGLQNSDESTGNISFVSDNDIETSPIHANKAEITQECRAVDADVSVPQADDNDAKYFAANENDKGIIGLLLLRNSKEVTVHGKLQLEVLKGRINILGYDVSPEDGQVPMFSSKLSALFGIKETSCKNKTDAMKEVICKQLKKVYGDEWVSIKEKLESYASVALFRKLVSLEMDFLCKYRSYKTLFSDPPKVEISKAKLEQAINVSNWREATDEIINVLSGVKSNSGFHILLCGNKNTGKSTFARYLINSILSRSLKTVFFLECDVGQTEFTPPGIISLSRVEKPLLGPPFTHQRDPIASLFFGNNTSKDEPSRYVRCIEEAFQFYITHHQSEGPLIINTQGWIKGVGLSLLADTIRLTRPMFVLQFRTQREVERGFTPLSHEFLHSHPGWVFEPDASIDNDIIDNENPTQYRIIETPDKHTDYRQFKSVDYRKLSILAHFSHLFTDKLINSFMVERPISCLVPRIVCWKDVAVHVMHSKVPPSLIMAAINFSLVSLSFVHPSMIIELSDEILPNGPKFLKHNPVASHIGFGFIRNIDIGKKAFVILTPLPFDKLINVNALLKGNIDIPLELIETDKLNSERLYCALKNNTVIRGTRARKPRFNLKRRKFASPIVATRWRHRINGLPQ